METIRDEISHMSIVSGITLSSSTPIGGAETDISIFPYGKDSIQAVYMKLAKVDEAFLTTYQIPILFGDFFKSSVSSSKGKIVVNEAAAIALGFRDSGDAVGKLVQMQGAEDAVTIIGIVKNFNFRSLKEQVKPVVLQYVQDGPSLFSHFSIKLSPGNSGIAVQAIESKVQSLLNKHFDVRYVDEGLNQLYQSELHLRKASLAATSLSLIIMFFGNLGLVSLSISRRSKELAVRKVLGASRNNIVMLFMREYLLIFLLASLISFPVGYSIMSNWLTSYAYKINLELTYFLFVSAIFIFIIAVQVSYQSIIAASVNPIKSLQGD